MKRIVVIIDEGIVSKVYSEDPDVKVEVIDIDNDKIGYDEAHAIYEELNKDTKLETVDYDVTVPGEEDEEQ